MLRRKCRRSCRSGGRNGCRFCAGTVRIVCRIFMHGILRGRCRCDRCDRCGRCRRHGRRGRSRRRRSGRRRFNLMKYAVEYFTAMAATDKTPMQLELVGDNPEHGLAMVAAGRERHRSQVAGGRSVGNGAILLTIRATPSSTKLVRRRVCCRSDKPILRVHAIRSARYRVHRRQ